MRAGDLTGTVDSFPVLTGEVCDGSRAGAFWPGRTCPALWQRRRPSLRKDNVETFATSDMAALRAALLAHKGSTLGPPLHL